MSQSISFNISRRSFLALSGATCAVGLPACAQSSGTLKAFSTPALIEDLPTKELQDQMNNAWNINATGWTEQAMNGDPFNSLFASDQSYYYNPLETDLTGSLVEKVSWTSFPNRIIFYFKDLTADQQFELCDFGTVSGVDLPEIPDASTVCAITTQGVVPNPITTKPFQPYGPRGWMDEYCEMAVTREGDQDTGRITRVDFVCENPEYWYTLWSVSPETVVEIYQDTLGRPQITEEDLMLKDSNGDPVIDPSTGRPAYNPLNKWNSGPRRLADSGGAMHLTSTPNTLQTEMGLAGGASVLRNQGNENASDLICCGQYGQIFRNSDPHIGQIANQVVGLGFKISLANPIGLYIQEPNFSNYVLPDDPNLPQGATAADCWQVLRGKQTLDLPGMKSNYNFILHAKFEIPQAWRDAGVSFEVGDIMIGGQKIKYGSQMLATIQIALFPRAVKAETPQTPLACVAGVDLPFAEAFPQQTMFQNLWDAYNSTNVPNVRDIPMTLASNTIIVAPHVTPGSTHEIAILGSSIDNSVSLPDVAYFMPGDVTPDPDIDVDVLAFENVNYAVPGNSEPGPQQMLKLRVKVAQGAKAGSRSVSIANTGRTYRHQEPFFLWVES